MYIEPIRITHTRVWGLEFWIVYSECGRFSDFFADVTDAICFAMQEYQHRVERCECQAWLDRI